MMETCSICHCDFDLNAEGGITGYLGILPAAFCPTCYAGLHDLVSQTCEWCIEHMELDEES